MLVLTRETGEQVEITVGGVTIIVSLLSTGRGRARLGFVAPQTVTVDRKEIADLKRMKSHRPAEAIQ